MAGGQPFGIVGDEEVTEQEELDFRIQVEKGFQTGAQLLLDLFLAAFENMHSHMRLPAIRQLHGRIPDLCHIF